jgi:hypothetical protein
MIIRYVTVWHTARTFYNELGALYSIAPGICIPTAQLQSNTTILWPHQIYQVDLRWEFKNELCQIA